MSSLKTLQATDKLSDSREDINDNFSALNTDKAEIDGQIFTGQISFNGTTHAGVVVISLTTTQRNALTPANGMIIYNSTDSVFQVYENGSWKNMISTSTTSIYRTYKLGSESSGGDNRTFVLDSGVFSAISGIEVYKNGSLMANGLSADYVTSGNNTIIFNYDVDDSDLIVLKVIE